MAVVFVLIAAVGGLATREASAADLQGPRILRVDRLNLPPSNYSFGLGDQIHVGVLFDEPVTVKGVPNMKLNVGSGQVNATYIESYNDDRAMKFAYSVRPGVSDSTGYSIPANSIVLNRATITDKWGNPAILTYDATEGHPFWRVNFNGPTITHINIGSSAGPDNVYHAGETIRFFAYFTEAVQTTGSPKLSFTVGNETKAADHYSTNGVEITFEYTVLQGDNDTDGISIPPNPIVIGTGDSITDVDNIDAELALDEYADNSLHKVQGIDTTGPIVTAIFITSNPRSGNAYQEGERIQFGVTFSETVMSPQQSDSTLTFNIGDQEATANFSANIGRSILYEYTVRQSDVDENGISVPANALSHGTQGNMTDLLANVAVLTHAAVSDNPGHQVQGTDTIGPTITSIEIFNNAPFKTFIAGETVVFKLQFSEEVNLNSGGTLTFMLGNTSKTASTSDPNIPQFNDNDAMYFGYTVQGGDQGHIDRIPSNAVSATDATRISDDAGNQADLNHAAILFEWPAVVNAAGGV